MEVNFVHFRQKCALDPVFLILHKKRNPMRHSFFPSLIFSPTDIFTAPSHLRTLRKKFSPKKVRFCQENRIKLCFN